MRLHTVRQNPVAFFADVGNNVVTRNGLHPAVFQVVVAVVEHFARLRKPALPRPNYPMAALRVFSGRKSVCALAVRSDTI